MVAKQQVVYDCGFARETGEHIRVIPLPFGSSITAAKLKISLKTVNEYCARLKKKLDAAKFNQLLRIAVLWRAGVAEIVVKAIDGSGGKLHNELY